MSSQSIDDCEEISTGYYDMETPDYYQKMVGFGHITIPGVWEPSSLAACMESL